MATGKYIRTGMKDGGGKGRHVEGKEKERKDGMEKGRNGEGKAKMREKKNGERL